MNRKPYWIALLCGVLMFVIVGCGNSSAPSSASGSTQPTATANVGKAAPNVTTASTGTTARSSNNDTTSLWQELPTNDCALIKAEDAQALFNDQIDVSGQAFRMEDTQPTNEPISGTESNCFLNAFGTKKGQGYGVQAWIWHADQATPSQWSKFWSDLKAMNEGEDGFQTVSGLGDDAYYYFGFLSVKKGNYVLRLNVTAPGLDNQKMLAMEKDVAAKVLTRTS